jgi:hypothetical protein
MDRNSYLKLRTNLDTEDNYIKLIQNYCLEKGKNIEDINKFINTIMHPKYLIVINTIIQDIINYYDNIFNLVTLSDKNNNIIKQY